MRGVSCGCADVIDVDDVNLLVEDQVRGEVEQLAVSVFVGAPAEGEGGQTHPGVLDQGDLVLDGQAPET